MTSSTGKQMLFIQYIYSAVSLEVETIRQWNLVS